MKADFLPTDVYSFLGCPVGVRANSANLLDHLRSMYGRFYLGSENPSAGTQTAGPVHVIEIVDRLRQDDELLLDDGFYSYRLLQTEGHSQFTCQNNQTLNVELMGFCDPFTLVDCAIVKTVSMLTKDYFLFHAGVISLNGDGIIFPADRGMGKTTLVLRLVTMGCKFLTDEVACLNPDRAIVEPFPRKLNIRGNSERLLRLALEGKRPSRTLDRGEIGWTVDIEEIVPASLGTACQPRFLVFLRGFGDEARMDRISNARALFELFPSGISSVADPAALLLRFAPLLDGIQCFTLVAGGLDETARLILELPGRTHRATE